jgi:hypothetical protein
MRTKVLLIAAAALAATVISSEAQVYSQNIVGYVNQPVIAGYSALALPLDLAAGNNLTNYITNPYNAVTSSGPYDGTTVYFWNGAGYTIVTLDSTQPTAVGDANDVNPVAGPVINPGTLIYAYNNTGVNLTNTVVGTVHVDGAASGALTVGTTTNAVPTLYTFLASKLPIGGGISSVLGLTNYDIGTPGNPTGVLDGSLVYLPKISPTGVFSGYNIVTYDITQTPSGFGDANDINEVAEPVIQVGSGFIIYNSTGVAYKWVQSL